MRRTLQKFHELVRSCWVGCTHFNDISMYSLLKKNLRKNQLVIWQGTGTWSTLQSQYRRKEHSWSERQKTLQVRRTHAPSKQNSAKGSSFEVKPGSLADARAFSIFKTHNIHDENSLDADEPSKLDRCKQVPSCLLNHLLNLLLSIAPNQELLLV